MNVLSNSSNSKDTSLTDENGGEDSVIIHPSDVAVSHRLFQSKALKLLFKSFGLSPSVVGRTQANLMDAIYLYLLDGTPKHLNLLLGVLTDDEDLWISLKGYRLMIQENLLPDLSALDDFLEQSKRRTLQRLKQHYIFD
ncbi:MAG: hypothetical protein AAGG68_02950 [Bacteroidota bacterium]